MVKVATKAMIVKNASVALILKNMGNLFLARRNHAGGKTNLLQRDLL